MKNYYETDTRELTIAEIAEILCDHYRCDSDDDGGCYKNGRWFSVADVLEAISERA